MASQSHRHLAGGGGGAAWLVLGGEELGMEVRPPPRCWWVSARGSAAPSLPQRPVLRLSLWALRDLLLGAHGSTPGAVPAVGVHREERLLTCRHLAGGFAAGPMSALTGSMQGVYGAEQGYVCSPLSAEAGARGEVLLTHISALSLVGG